MLFLAVFFCWIVGRLFPVERIFLEDILDEVEFVVDKKSRYWKPPSKLALNYENKFEHRYDEPLPVAGNHVLDEDLTDYQV